MRNISDTLKSLGDENRLRIFMMLHIRPMCVCEINAVLDVAPSTISSHLKNLKYAGLIEDTKDGRWVLYKLSDNDFARDIRQVLVTYLQNDNRYKHDVEKVKKINRDDLKC